MFVLRILLALFATGYCKTQIEDRAWKFGLELMYHTAEQTNWHTIISPLAAWSLLTEVSIATTKECQVQLKNNHVLPITKMNAKNYKVFMDDIIRSLVDDVALKRKNFLFIDIEAKLNETFSKYIRSQFRIKIQQLDFQMPNKAANISNKVIKESFRDSDKVLLPGDFNDSSEIILTNLITFKGLWRLPFNEAKTRMVPFYDESGHEIGKVNMMQQQGCFSFMYMPSISASVLELPYGKDDVYSFLVIYPFSDKIYPSTTKTVYQRFLNTSIRDILATLENNVNQNGKVYATINLPRFKLSSNVVLNEPLQNMRISNIFDKLTNSFAPISKMRNLHVSAIVHNAVIEVIETGTVAITSRIVEKCTSTPSTFINSDRPFLYYIVEKSRATVIFSGVYSKPTVH